MGAKFCQRLFLHLLRWSCGFIFQFVNIVYHIDCFTYFEESLHLWDKPNLIIIYELLMCCWILFTRILLRILHLCSSVILACSFLFWCCLCLILVSGWWWPHRMSLEVLLPLQFFGKSFWRIGISPSLNVWYNSHVSYLVLGFCFLGDFWSQLQFQCL